MLFLGVLIGVWIGVPLGVLMVGMLGPRDREQIDPRAMQDLLARRYPPAGDRAAQSLQADRPEGEAAQAATRERGRRSV